MLIATVLLGCSVVDRYSSRAIVYNLEAEKAQEQAMLLNIVRASLGRPMQFTTVSTITGTASASGSAQYQFPTNVPFGPVVSSVGIAFPPVVPNAAFGGAVSGGPTFTVPVLDTQEFYRGILTAIPGKIWDLYIQAGYPRDLLFNLFVEKVVMQRVGDHCPYGHSVAQCEIVFSNHVAADIDIDLFQALGDYMLALGLTTEKTTDAPSVPFDNPASINVRFVGDPPEGKPHDAEVLGAPGGSGSDSLSASTTYVLCFAPLDPRYAALVQSSLCGKKHDGKTRGSEALAGDQADSGLAANRIRPSGSATVALEPSPEFITRLMRIANEHGYHALAERLAPFGGNKSVKITVYLRHTEGMIHYLGELVRRQAQDGRAIFVKLDAPYTTHDTTNTCVEADKRTGCAYIFHLNLGSEPGDVVSVFYDGLWFSLPPGSAEDLSSLSFDFLKQQIALNSAAKSLPQSSILTTVGP
jgi:hypothetical protein